VAPVAALSADLDGIADSKEAEVAHPLEHPVRELALALPVERLRLQLGLDELADRPAELLVLLGEEWMAAHLERSLPTSR
jgi:hypothetical protein